MLDKKKQMGTRKNKRNKQGILFSSLYLAKNYEKLKKREDSKTKHVYTDKTFKVLLYTAPYFLLKAYLPPSTKKLPEFIPISCLTFVFINDVKFS